MMSTKNIAAVVAALFLLPVAANAVPLEVNDVRYLGSVTPGLPPNEANETAWVQRLVDLAPGAQPVEVINNTVTRSGNVFANLPSPVVYAGKTNVDDSKQLDPIDLGIGYAYLLGKYGAGSAAGEQIIHVWYVGGLTEASIPLKALSHYVKFNPGTQVPDAGSTLALLGLAICGLGFARRKLN